ncbi:Phosphoethanolamine transferase eptB [Serratia quinivorans]|uniref:Phosphoethanolamine transferase eptB n=1 Tax=Serratia quinivorans TaxID=137545 RepID=A0A379YEC6_9GAMM|nr:Phosphoethanolamine transferase eptB [Serratia quinivorans]
MQKFRRWTQLQVSFFIAFYLGVLLNIPIFYRRYQQLHYDNSLSIGIEVLAAFCLVCFITLLISFLGRRLFRVLASLLVLSSVAASYYMVLFHVDIGYGILAAVMTTDVDLSKESVGWHFGVWVVLVSLLPLLLIWLAPMHEASYKRANHLAWYKKGGVMLTAGLLCWLPLKLMGAGTGSSRSGK